MAYGLVCDRLGDGNKAREEVFPFAAGLTSQLPMPPFEDRDDRCLARIAFHRRWRGDME